MWTKRLLSSTATLFEKLGVHRLHFNTGAEMTLLHLIVRELRSIDLICATLHLVEIHREQLRSKHLKSAARNRLWLEILRSLTSGTDLTGLGRLEFFFYALEGVVLRAWTPHSWQRRLRKNLVRQSFFACVDIHYSIEVFALQR